MKKILITFILIYSIVSLFSQETDFSTLSEKKILKIIDKAIDEKDQELISIMGNMGPDFPNYQSYESHVLDKAREFIDSDDLTYPLMLVEAVIYNNLENKDAQELYSAILNKNIETQERIAEEKEQEIIRAKDAKKLNSQIGKAVSLEEEKARIILMTKKLEEYKSKLPKRTTLVSNNFFYPFLWKNYSSEVYDQYTNQKPETKEVEGQGLEFSLGLNTNIIMFKFDLYGNITSDNLFYETKKQFMGNGTFSIGINAGPIPIFLRSGFLYQNYMYNDNEESDVAMLVLSSPTIGLGIKGLSIFRIIKIDLNSDYIIASNYTDNFSNGFSSQGYITVNLFRSSKYNFDIKGGMDYIYLLEDGLEEHSITPKIGFGISSYE